MKNVFSQELKFGTNTRVTFELPQNSRILSAFEMYENIVLVIETKEEDINSRKMENFEAILYPQTWKMDDDFEFIAAFPYTEDGSNFMSNLLYRRCQ